MNKEQIAVLARLAYMIQWGLGRRFPNIQVIFTIKSSEDALLINAEISSSDAEKNRWLNLGGSLDGILSTFCTDARFEDFIYVDQAQEGEVAGRVTYTRCLKALGADVSKIIQLLDRTLPLIPDGQTIPNVVVGGE